MTRLILQGDFLSFRNFMLDLGTIPSLERVEEVVFDRLKHLAKCGSRFGWPRSRGIQSNPNI